MAWRCDQTSQLADSVIVAPFTNSSSAWMLVGVSTGMTSPLRGSLVMVRVGLAIDDSAATRFTGPMRLIRLAM
ncbi:hypothetical protein D9M72_648500 [compost metagenome]